MKIKITEEQYNRLTRKINLTEEVGNCYPSDYEEGKKYNREVLSQIFTCISGPNFPPEGVSEWLFPLIPSKEGHVSPMYDPKRWQVGPNEYTSMEEFVDKTTKNFNGLTLKDISITPSDLHPESLNFIETKQNSMGYQDRVNFQKKRVKENGVMSLTQNEPFVFEIRDGKYFLQEGWHRFMTLFDMYNDGEINNIVGKAWVAQ
jgi:hypothetical protein